jgi:hypothetical protein
MSPKKRLKEKMPNGQKTEKKRGKDRRNPHIMRCGQSASSLVSFNTGAQVRHSETAWGVLEGPTASMTAPFVF